MNILWLDTETRCKIPIKRGTYRYASESQLRVVTWAWNNEPTQTWYVDWGPPPAALIWAMNACDVVYAHNAVFDRLQNQRNCPLLPLIPRSKWRCMMARAYRHGLPGKLEKLSEIFQLKDNAKIDGGWLIKLFCVPKKDGTYNDDKSHPCEWDLFLAYAGQDIVAMRALDTKIPKWNNTPFEDALYLLDQERNDRGFAVDVELAVAAIKAVTEESKKMADRVEYLTEGQVKKATQRDKLLKWLLAEHGVELPDMKADTIERRLEDPELPDMVKEMLRLRLRASKASASKYKRVVECHIDGRLHGTIQYCGAQRTGRDAGRLFQPQNLARLDLDAVAAFYGCKVEELPKGAVVEYLALALDMIKGGGADLVFGDGLMSAASNILRGVIVAAVAMKLVVSDLANIEGRMLAWMANEIWKLEAFRAFDRKEGPDLYKVAYARAFAVLVSLIGDDSDERQIGKVMELALGYQGGVGAFVTMAVTYGIDLDLMAETAWATIPEHVLADSRARYAKALENTRSGLGLEEKVWVVCQSLVTMWRKAHPATVKFWWRVEECAKAAVGNPGREFKAGSLTFDRRGNWLRMRLPSGRYLCYPAPRIEEDGGLTYAGVNQYTRQWGRIHTYAGKLVENAVQAASRDVLKEGEILADGAGYPPVLVVHDELICETPDTDDYTVGELSALLATVPTWAPGLPLAAKGIETKRYRKG